MNHQNQAEADIAIKDDQEDIEDVAVPVDLEVMRVIQEVGQIVDQAEVIGVTVDAEEEVGQDLEAAPQVIPEDLNPNHIQSQDQDLQAVIRNQWIKRRFKKRKWKPRMI